MNECIIGMGEKRTAIEAYRAKTISGYKLLSTVFACFYHERLTIFY